MIVHIEYDSSRKLGQIRSASLDLIREKFSEADDQAIIKRKISGSKYMPNRKYCITKSGKFELGMTQEIVKFIKSTMGPHRITYSDDFKASFLCGFDFYNDPLADINKPADYKERYYQPASIRKALKVGNGIFLLKTAAGKTFISAQLIATIQENRANVKTMIVVPTVQLVEQTYKEFLFFGFKSENLSKWSGKNPLNPSADVIIASSSILLSKKQDLSVLSDINLLIIDECHTFKKGNQINNILKLINTRNRFGFTGTLPESKIDQWNVIGKIGPVLYELSRDEMVENNFIADAEIEVIFFDYKNKPAYKAKTKEEKEAGIVKDPLLNYQIETRFTEGSVFRNNIIRKITSKISKNILIVVEHIKHGEKLLEILSDIPNKQVFFIRGEVEMDDREKFKQIMELDDNVICIAISKIFSTGISIKNLHYILFVSAGKAKVKIIQSIGRGVRLHKNKNKLFIFDFADNLRYGLKHLIRRKEIYEEEGFNVRETRVTEKN